MKYEIDSTNKTLGRIATEAASVLMGKNSTAYARNVAPKVTVVIKNAALVRISPKKMNEGYFRHHTGYRGGLKEVSLERFIKEKGYKELVKKTIYGMLPINKLRPIMIKNLEISE